MMVCTPRRSQVYIVRTWTEEWDADLVEIRGMVRNVHSGETRYFRTWKDLLQFVADDALEQQGKCFPDRDLSNPDLPHNDVTSSAPDLAPDGQE